MFDIFNFNPLFKSSRKVSIHAFLAKPEKYPQYTSAISEGKIAVFLYVLFRTCLWTDLPKSEITTVHESSRRLRNNFVSCITVVVKYESKISSSVKEFFCYSSFRYSQGGGIRTLGKNEHIYQMISKLPSFKETSFFLINSTEFLILNLEI